ncbi:MAG: T9SS type A sorting domain-containing protein [Ignavibacteria bacterium]|nr:T9SS type A sorting domain-containing protein [Ignavibacteria bacterium]
MNIFNKIKMHTLKGKKFLPVEDYRKFFSSRLKFGRIITVIIIMLFVFNDAFPQWIQQDVPVNASNVYALKFFDANTGLITATGGRVYRTTNGGNNWVLLGGFYNIYRMDIIDSTTVYGCGVKQAGGLATIFRSYNRGNSWDSVGISNLIYTSLSFVNRDTGWISAALGFTDYIFRTTDGGVTLTVQTTEVGWGEIFFLRKKINGEYYGWATGDLKMYRTTNSGTNWFWISSHGPGAQLYFIDENTGWFAGGAEYFWKTTNGGFNWTTVIMPSGNNLLIKYLRFFDIINRDTIYGSGGNRNFYSGIKGIIWKSTNGGINWGFQQPDTTYPYGLYAGMDFTDSLTGWSTNIHTTNGGGAVIISGINPLKTEIPRLFRLEQNYPNPFNPQTTIEFSIAKPSFVTLCIYDISGKEVIKVYDNRFLSAGNYKTVLDFGKTALSSGVYMCRLFVYGSNNQNSDMIFSDTKKLIYIK